MVALGRRARLLPDGRTQSAFGHARLGLVLLYVRRRSTADHGNRSRSTYTEIPEPSLTRRQPAARGRRTLREGASAFTSASARYGVSNREEQNKSIARIGTRLPAVRPDRRPRLAFPLWSYLSCYPARFMASPQITCTSGRVATRADFAVPLWCKLSDPGPDHPLA
jgi:hypothetical protein